MDNNAISNTTEVRKTRSSRGRQRIEIKKLEDENKRRVTFSKRRKGLFNKAKELSTLCGAEVGVLALSKFGRVYGNDNVDVVIDRFHGESSGHCNDSLLKQKEVERDINVGFWLDQRIENLGLAELVEYALALKDLRENATTRLEELSIQNSTCLWSLVADQDIDKAEFVHQFKVEGNQDWCLNSCNVTPLESWASLGNN
ncbi:hypothetical protein CRYUN_Cryun37aG0070700 [Craigia yunnanensis]